MGIRGWIPVALLCLSASCIPEEQQQTGELGAGEFTYVCLRPSDAQCDLNEEVAPAAFQHIVRGAVVGVHYEEDLPGETGFAIRAVNLRATFLGDDDEIDPEIEEGTFLESGLVALLALRGPKARDLIHARVLEPAGIQISRRDGEVFTGSFGDASVTISVGAAISLRAAPVDEAGTVLAGALDCEWSSSDETVVAIRTDPTDNVIELDLLGAGTATLSVTLGELQATTDVIVEAP